MKHLPTLALLLLCAFNLDFSYSQKSDQEYIDLYAGSENKSASNENLANPRIFCYLFRNSTPFNRTYSISGDNIKWQEMELAKDLKHELTSKDSLLYFKMYTSPSKFVFYRLEAGKDYNIYDNKKKKIYDIEVLGKYKCAK